MSHLWVFDQQEAEKNETKEQKLITILVFLLWRNLQEHLAWSSQ